MGASAYLSAAKCTGWDEGFLWLSGLLGLRLAIVLSACKPWVAVFLFLVVITIPIVLGYEPFVVQWTSPFSRWGGGNFIVAGLFYLLIPAGSLFVDLVFAPSWNCRALVVRIAVEVFVVSPLWFAIMFIIVTGASHIP